MASYEKFDHPPFPPSYGYEQGDGPESDQKVSPITSFD